EVSINKIATLIANEFDYLDKLVFDETLPDGQYKKTADNTTLKNLISYYKFIDIEEGIKITVEWFNNNYDFLRK
ncbi:MAG: GDP-L-fucose synthase, partial [Candidatus Fonsibacter sp.]